MLSFRAPSNTLLDCTLLLVLPQMPAAAILHPAAELEHARLAYHTSLLPHAVPPPTAGLYDSPKSSPGTPISGSLAQRSTAGHGRRLPPAAYAQMPV